MSGDPGRSQARASVRPQAPTYAYVADATAYGVESGDS
jgi:hypothetical protein